MTAPGPPFIRMIVCVQVDKVRLEKSENPGVAPAFISQILYIICFLNLYLFKKKQRYTKQLWLYNDFNINLIPYFCKNLQKQILLQPITSRQSSSGFFCFSSLSLKSETQIVILFQGADQFQIIIFLTDLQSDREYQILLIFKISQLVCRFLPVEICLSFMFIFNIQIRTSFEKKSQQQQLKMKEGTCRQHKNPAELICLHDQCHERLMCMLCEHNHEFFTSVRAKSQVNWKYFKKKVDESIDLSMKIIDNIEQGGVQDEKKIVIQYYNNLRQTINNFIDLRMNQNIALFNSSKNSDSQFLIRARIEGKYNDLPVQLFRKIKQVYEGKDLQSLAREEQQRNLQNAYTYMKQFHEQLESLFSKFKIEFKTKIPEIRIKSQLNNSFNRVHVQSYDQVLKPKQKQTIKYENDVQIQSMISDAYSGKKQIMTVGFDKNLRIFDKNLKIICSKQFNNIITRIQPIGDDFFALALSKQLRINKITNQDAYDIKHILTLKGHTERIWDVSSFNTRIIGSCSEQGTRIWDLYKQRCQFTLRQEVNPSCMKFMRSSNMLAIGYYNHQVKIYSIVNMKPSRSYQMTGTPLSTSQQNRNQNLIYLGGFDSDLWLFDIRVAKEVFRHNFKSEAVTCFKESIFQQETMLIGQRGGKVRIFDLRKIKSRLEWSAHTKMTNLSRPNGVIRIFQQGFNEILTVGSNDRRAIIWGLENVE